MLAFRLAVYVRKLQPTQVHPIRNGHRCRAAAIQHGERRADEPWPSAPPAGTPFLNAVRRHRTPWATPRLPLAPEQVLDDDIDGLALTVQLLEGTGTKRGPIRRSQRRIVSGRGGCRPGQPVASKRVVVLFWHCRRGLFSPTRFRRQAAASGGHPGYPRGHQLMAKHKSPPGGPRPRRVPALTILHDGPSGPSPEL